MTEHTAAAVKTKVIGDDRVFDLEERTARFGEALIRFLGSLPKSDINRPMIVQTVRAGTSVGANYMEANGAESTRDFRYRLAVCRKEAKETAY
jgi:four helix bundle protein